MAVVRNRQEVVHNTPFFFIIACFSLLLHFSLVERISPSFLTRHLVAPGGGRYYCSNGWVGWFCYYIYSLYIKTDAHFFKKQNEKTKTSSIYINTLCGFCDESNVMNAVFFLFCFLKEKKVSKIKYSQIITQRLENVLLFSSLNPPCNNPQQRLRITDTTSKRLLCSGFFFFFLFIVGVSRAIKRDDLRHAQFSIRIYLTNKGKNLRAEMDNVRSKFRVSFSRLYHPHNLNEKSSSVV